MCIAVSNCVFGVRSVWVKTGKGAVTVTQLGCTPLVRLLEMAVMLAAALVKAAGLVAHEALSCPGTFVTLTVTVQLLLASTLPPLKLMVVPPATAVTVPPHEPTMLGGVATRRLPGKVSVKASPLCATEPAAGLVIVKVSVVKPPLGKVVGLNDLVKIGLGGPAEQALQFAALTAAQAAAVSLLVTSLLKSAAMLPWTLPLTQKLRCGALGRPEHSLKERCKCRQ